MSNPTLTDAQRDRFARNGFLVLRDAVPVEILADARDSVAQTVPEELDDFEALAAGPERRNYWGELDEMEPFGRLNDLLFEYAEELVGPGALDRPGEFAQVAVRYPEGEFACDADRPTTAADGNPHVDGFRPDDDYLPFTVGATVYLDDVAPRAGGLTVWPGSHWRIADYFADHDLEEFANDETEAILGENCAPFEVAGDAGTVVLWHNKLVHTGGMHLGRRPRIASFSRFVREDVEETMRDAAARPFAYWGGVESVSDVGRARESGGTLP